MQTSNEENAEKTKPVPVQSALPEPGDKEKASAHEIVEEFASGDLQLGPAFRKGLNAYPLKRGWYIVIILFLLTAVVGVWNYKEGKVEEAEKDRDKWFLAYQPFSAEGQKLTNIAVSERMTKLLEITSIAVAGQLKMAQQIDDMHRKMKAAEVSAREAMLREFPEGYFFFTLVGPRGLVKVQGPGEYKIDWKKLSVTVRGGGIDIRLPAMETPDGLKFFMQNTVTIPARNGGEALLHIDPAETNIFVGNAYGSSTANTERRISARPTLTIVVRSVILQGVGNAVLVGIKKYAPEN